MFGVAKRIVNKVKAVKKTVSLAAVLLFASPLLAVAAGKPKPSSLDDPFMITLLIIAIILLLIIALLSYVMVGAAGFILTGYKKTSHDAAEHAPVEEQEKTSPAMTVVSAVLLLLFSSPLLAQDGSTPMAVAAGSSSGDTGFYVLVSVIFFELIVIFALLYNLRSMLAKQKKAKVQEEVAHKPKRIVNWWTKINSFRPMEQEAQLDLGHEYDGIRELDNRLPPWWLYGFYVSIVFAGIYLWRYHVSHTAPLSIEEYQLAVAKAEKEKEAYLKKAANLVDENTVVLLTDAGSMAAGQKIYDQNCAACHGKQGEGTVGPNLTDDYWLHGGSLKDIFKSVKYGWPEKGMRSWKEDLSPSQIAQVSGYISSLHGTNPANPKEAQGELYKAATTAASDSAAVNPVTVSQ